MRLHVGRTAVQNHSSHEMFIGRRRPARFKGVGLSLTERPAIFNASVFEDCFIDLLFLHPEIPSGLRWQRASHWRSTLADRPLNFISHVPRLPTRVIGIWDVDAQIVEFYLEYMEQWPGLVLGIFVWIGQSKAKNILGRTTRVVYLLLSSSSHLPTKFSQLPNLHTFISSSPLNVLTVLALHPSLLLLGHRHHHL